MDQTADRDRATRVSAAGPADGSRACLLDGPIGLVEDVRGGDRPPAALITGYSSSFQVALPYRGLFVWHVGGDDVVGDSNQVLYVTRGESYSLSQPLGGAYAELIVTPEQSVLSELTWRAGTLRARSSATIRSANSVQSPL